MSEMPEAAVEAARAKCLGVSEQTIRRLLKAAAPAIHKQRDEELRERLGPDEILTMARILAPGYDHLTQAQQSGTRTRAKLALEGFLDSILEEADRG